jgi:hypothetical protein
VAYDALFKELLRSFFREFMERFFPEEAARLDFSQVTFLEQEMATDLGSGHQRTLDLIARAKEVVREANPLAAALGVLGDRRGADPAVLKATSLNRIGQARLDEARQYLLVNFVETYLPLQVEAEQRYQELLAREEHRMAKQVQMTWGDRIREEASREARLLEKRDAVLRVLRLRFGATPEDLVQRIEAIGTLAELNELLERALTANHPDEVRAALPN